MTTKEKAKEIIDGLPAEASIDEIMQALYVHAKFQRGEDQITQGKGVPHEEARKRLAKWLK